MRLSDYLQETNTSCSVFAGRIGTSAVTVTRYLAGTRTPRRDVLQRIANVTKGAVTPDDFLLAEPFPTSQRRDVPSQKLMREAAE
jgi:transcriptional regulator with XRE-family HTH domain